MDQDFLHAINGDWDALLVALRENRQVAKYTDASGMTVLHWVCLHQDASTDIVVKVIFANPYAVHVRNEAGHLPIDLAEQAECGERILEVLRAAAQGNRRPEDDSDERHEHDGFDKSGEDRATETIGYELQYNDHTILHDNNEIRDGSDYQPHQNQTYYGHDEDCIDEDGIDEDEREYQQHHRHYQAQSFQERPIPKTRLERSVSDQDSFFDPLWENFDGPNTRGGCIPGLERDRGGTLPRNDPHVKSLLTEQRLRERENDLISIATVEESLPFSLFDPSKGRTEMSMVSRYQRHEDPKGTRNTVVLNSASKGAGPRSKTLFPPRWKQSRICHVCACGFTLVKRRHHCRNCGQSVCSQHSTNRVSLPKFALSEPQRVCDQCFLSGHHIMIPDQTGTPSIASSYQSLPSHLQREEMQRPYQSMQSQMQFQHAR